MRIFGKSQKNENTLAADAMQKAVEELAKEYSELKGKEYQMKKRREEIEGILKQLADVNRVWKGNTARFNQYALERKEVKNLLLPAQMSVEDFEALESLGYVKRELDKAKILKNLGEDPVFEQYGFEVEIKERLALKGF